jgi:hypothetical protein
MRWLIWRELAVAARTPALWGGLCGHVVVLFAFVIVWGDGVPVFASQPVFEQFLFVQSVVLTLVLPWIAARCLGEDTRHLPVLAVLTAASPSRLVAAKCVSATVVLCVVVASALPAAALALQISAFPITRLLLTVPAFAATCGFIAAVTVACMLTSGSRLAGWLLATAMTVIGLYGGPRGIFSSAMLAILALAVAASIARWADTKWRYLPEDGARTA